MADLSVRLMEALEALEAVADEVSSDEAATQLDDATLQLFWRRWPNASSWAGSLWRRLNAELGEAAVQASPDDLVGGSE